MPNQESRRRWYYVYSLVTGIAGILILIQLFADRGATIDLFTALLFTVVVLVLSYFRVPIRNANAEIGLDGAVLLGATLVGGATLGGWAAFITGLVKSFLPFFPRQSGRRRWLEHSATALWGSGRNVLSVAAAWWAYRGLGGSVSPLAVSTSLALAVVVLCVVYALVRCFVAWPAIILQSESPRRAFANAINATTFLVELAPLPSAVLVSATYVELGCSFFLLLSLVLIGLGAVTKRMLDTIATLREQRDTLAFANQVSKVFSESPADIHALCEVAYEICAECVPADKFEIGLYDSTSEQVHIEMAVYDHTTGNQTPADEQGAENTPLTRLPPMRVPVTPLWEWIRGQQQPVLLSTQQDLDELPFSLPQQEQKEGPPSLMIVPLVESPRSTPTVEAGAQGREDSTPIAEAREPGSEDSPQPGAPHAPTGETQRSHPVTIGAITVQAALPGAYSPQDLVYVAIVAEGLSAALRHAPEWRESIQLPGKEPHPPALTDAAHELR